MKEKGSLIPPPPLPSDPLGVSQWGTGPGDIFLDLLFPVFPPFLVSPEPVSSSRKSFPISSSLGLVPCPYPLILCLSLTMHISKLFGSLSLT